MDVSGSAAALLPRLFLITIVSSVIPLLCVLFVRNRLEKQRFHSPLFLIFYQVIIDWQALLGGLSGERGIERFEEQGYQKFGISPPPLYGQLFDTGRSSRLLRDQLRLRAVRRVTLHVELSKNPQSIIVLDKNYPSENQSCINRLSSMELFQE